MTLIEPFGNRDSSKGKCKDIQYTVEKLGNYMSKNMKENNIPRLSEYFSLKAVKFSEFKESYRLVVGHIFSKAHKEIS